MRMPRRWLVLPKLVGQSRCLITECLTDTDLASVVDGPQTLALMLLRLPYTAPIRIDLERSVALLLASTAGFLAVW